MIEEVSQEAGYALSIEQIFPAAFTKNNRLESHPCAKMLRFCYNKFEQSVSQIYHSNAFATRKIAMVYFPEKAADWSKRLLVTS